MSDRCASWGRREFVAGLTLASTIGLAGIRPEPVAAEPPPETTRLRIADPPGGICGAPQHVAGDLLRGEGFTDLQYLKTPTLRDYLRVVATGEAHILTMFVSSLLVRLDAGDPVVILTGSHVGCFELFSNDHVRSISDLRGKTVAVSELGAPDHLFLSVIITHVGLDPRQDVKWVTHPRAEAMRLLAEGKIDALLNFPPVPQELRARKVGRVLVNSNVDRPWVQYFCCMVAANREFVSKHPIATKRVVRALMKGADICAREPERTARFLVDKGYAASYDYALQALRDVPYAKWREYDPEDAVRFYALRMHEAGLIKSSPQKVIAQGTDWRFLKELKRELKG
jgi:NitT/TauT family transport system substrate-binding protein